MGRELRRSRAAVLGLAVVGLWALAAILAPWLAPHSPTEQHLADRLSPPSARYPLGTDELGRDVLSRVLYGARLSVPTALGVVALTALLGTVLGAVSGFAGGLVDETLMRVSDAVLAFPSLILAMAITAALGPGLRNALLAMVLVLWPEYARIVRGQVLSIREMEYVVAARALGARDGRILRRHVAPNIASLALVKASLDVGNVMIIAAALSFVGLGATPPAPEWGAMVAAGRQKFFEWWVGTFPGLAIFTAVMGFNFLGDGLRDVMDARLRGVR
ncbi:MAG: ABC transporter permease [Armatimonadota bacterium]|nr:ABC transporter permease [Armatimonadota bacterium]MDR7533262.1 ABC transporter permease [Armatimonadota bacterium]MDR7536945.1 ABC transporter permease [Armatimonadota bacterium]